MKRHHMDALRVAGGDFTAHERKLRKALRELIRASHGLTSAIPRSTSIAQSLRATGSRSQHR